MFNRYLNKKVKLKANYSYFLNTGVFYLERDEIGKLCEVSIYFNKDNKTQIHSFSVILNSNSKCIEFLTSDGKKKIISFLIDSTDVCVKIKFYNIINYKKEK